MTTEVTEAMAEAALRDWSNGGPFPAYQKDPAAWMRAIVALAIKKSANEIRQAERERCAKLAEWYGEEYGADVRTGPDIAAAIRARGDTTDVT